MTQTPAKSPSPAHVHEWRMRVYYEDTDAGGIVYYANYLKFAERARTELLRQGGIEQQAFKDKRDLVFVVKSCRIEYEIPARLDDNLIIRTEVVALGGASLDLAQIIWRDSEERPLAKLAVRIACLRFSSSRPERIPEDVKALFAAYRPAGIAEA